MALVFMDSFDHYSTDDLGKKYDGVSGNACILDSIPRRPGTKYLRCVNGSVYKHVVDRVTGTEFYDFVYGGALLYTSVGGEGALTYALRNEGGVVQCQFRFDGSGRVEFQIGGVWYRTDVNFVNNNTWFHIEVKGKIDPAVGWFEVRLNEVMVLSESGLNTQAQAGGIGQIYMGGGLAMWGDVFFDDVYLLDGNASDDLANPNNDFLGDCRIDCIYPDAAGTYTQYTPSEGDNYQNVDDGTVVGGGDIDDDATYNESVVVGEKETYNMDSISSLGKSIYAIAANSCCRKTDAGRRYFKQLTISGAANDLSEEKYLTDFYKVYQKPLDVNPDDSEAWEEADINAIESGTQITV